MENDEKSIAGPILKITQPPFGRILLPVSLVPPAKRIEQNDHSDPDTIDCPEIETEVAQPAGHEISGGEDVFAPIASIIHEQEHGQPVDDIEVQDIEKEGNSPKYDHGPGKTVSHWLDQRQENECGTYCHEQEVQGWWIFRRVQKG